MTKAIRIHETGGPEVLRWEEVDLAELKQGEVRIPGVWPSLIKARLGSGKNKNLSLPVFCFPIYVFHFLISSVHREFFFFHQFSFNFLKQVEVK